jgi:isopentenyl-diphosphate delta-isomerase
MSTTQNRNPEMVTAAVSDTASAQQEGVVLVDENDRSIGLMDKLQAHQGKGILHRAFSVFIFNDERKLLLQQRAQHKYHFGGLWANTCCSHPRQHETVLAAGHRRLQEEFGFDTELKEAFSFIYRAEDPQSKLVEHEYDHVLIGRFNGKPQANPDEIATWKWISLTELVEDIKHNPSHYTAWLQIALNRVIAHPALEF